MTEQLELIKPDSLPEPESITVQIADINEEGLIGRALSKGFTKSVEQYGILEPIILVRNGRRYDIFDGRLRVLTAAHLKIETVKAEVYPEGTDGTAIMMVVNEQRSHNIATDLLGIEQHKANHPGTPEDRLIDIIFKLTSKPKVKIKRLLKLINELPPSLLDALKEGWLGITTADEIIKCSDTVKAQCVEVFKKEGKLAKVKVRELKNEAARLERQRLTDMQPELFVFEPSIARQTVDKEDGDWKLAAARLANELRLVIPDEEVGNYSEALDRLNF